jgi:glutamine amidotransferase-like uncharacterized protein
MKKSIIFLVVVALAAFIGCVGPGVNDTSVKPLKVAVFVGNGARNIGSFRWLQITARAKNVVAIPVDGELVKKGALDSVDVFVMPGGSSVLEAKTLGQVGRDKVKEFVKNGGRYIGTCAGCCLLMEPASHHPNMLHMIPFKFGPSGGKAEMSIAFNDRAKELAGIIGKERVRYSEGPVPLPSTPVEGANVEVVATYNSDINTKGANARPSMAGKAAAIAGTYGKGRLFVFTVHPESDENDHYLLKGAFRYLTGCDLEWDYAQRKRGQLVVGFMCDDSFGVETAKLVQKLVTEEEFDVVPLNKACVASGYLRHVDAVLAPNGEYSKKPSVALYAANAQYTKAFLARGGRIFAWGSAAEAAKENESGVTCVVDSEAALEALRKFAATPVDKDDLKRVCLTKVGKPIRAGIFQNERNSNIPIARALAFSPEYDMTILAPEDYTNGVLEKLDLVIQPGGGCTSQYKALGEKGAEALKRFVRDGGKYYGVCAGAFLAMQQSREGFPRLGLIPFKGDDPSYYRGDAPIKIAFTKDGMEALDTTNKTRTVIYFGGPAAVPGTPIEDTDVKVFAKYAGRIINTRQPKSVQEMIDKGAFLGGRVGKGKVFISCPHPEKDDSTFDIVRNGFKYLTGIAPSDNSYLDRVRGAVTVRYRSSDKASVQCLFNEILTDKRMYVWGGKNLTEIEHVDVYVCTDEVKKSDVADIESFIARGGKVVLVADTPAELKAAKNVKGAVVIESYENVVDAILK